MTLAWLFSKYPAKPFKSVQFVIAASVQQGQTSAFITTQGGVWQAFDIMGTDVVIHADESVFITPFIDSTGIRTAGLTLLEQLSFTFNLRL
jgi:hypothetical protein